LRNGEDVAGGGKLHWDKGGWSGVVAVRNDLAEVSAALLLDLAAGEELDLETADSGLDVGWDVFEFEAAAGEFVRSEDLGDLGVEIVDLVIARGEGLKSDANIFLVVVLVLEGLDLVLAISEELLGFWGWVILHHFGELSSSQEATFKLGLKVGSEGKMLWVEVGRSEGDRDVFGQTVLHVVGAAGFSLRLESWEEVGGFVVA
jgi:hypothetical protein